MKSAARAGGVSMIVFALAFFAWMAIDRLAGPDGDDPALRLAFIREHPHTYVYAGIALVLMGIVLTVATLAVSEVATGRLSSLALKAVSAIGLFSAAFFFAHGVLLGGTTGTLVYIDDLDHDWGSAAYLAVQIAGTQGFASAGLLALSVWAVCISVLGIRRNVFPLALSLLGVFPAFAIMAFLFGRLVVLPGIFYLFFVASLFGGMLWCLTLGIVLLRWTPPQVGAEGFEPPTSSL